jgi:outer membrane protein assembly factor BamB
VRARATDLPPAEVDEELANEHVVRRVGLVTLAVATFVGLGVAPVGVAATHSRAAGSPIAPGDWPTYGHDAQHTFHGQTTITPTTASGLGRAWFFPTGDAVTATPTVVAGTVYVGSWDTRFYAIELATGQLLWQFQLDPQPKVEPQPGEVPRPFDSDGGMVTSSAWFEPGSGKRPDLVIFGGGYTLYALRAADGSVYWKHAYPGRPDRPPDPTKDGTRIFSSPVVVDGNVIIGTSVDGDRGRRGYVVAASLTTGNPVWVHETDVDRRGKVLNDGCGSVWSSGTLLPKAGLVVFGVADCHFANPPPLSETVVALRVRDGGIAWTYRPKRNDTQCDFDFGATANAGLGHDGTAGFLGVGGKEGTYYSLDPGNGKERWHTNVVFGGFSGGFIATAAYDGRRVYGSTAIGDFGRFAGETGESMLCNPSNPRDQQMQEPSAHAFDARMGTVAWQADQSAAFGPTTVAGGLTFHGVALRTVLQVRRADTGELVSELPLEAPCWSGVATVGNAIVFGTGASQQGSPDGVLAYTPGGAAPVVRESRTSGRD